jgi:pimeloyl-ACP methyl ester carboxylesterase
MNEMAKVTIKGEEHWTAKDDGVKLFLWQKAAGDPAKARATILFVHGSSMASQPTFDLQIPGRVSAMDHFAQRGFDCWSVDMEGYGRSTKDRDNNAPIAQGADDCYAAALHIQKLRGKCPLLVYGISSGALRAALFAQRHPEMVARLALDAPPPSPSDARSCPNSWPRTDGRSTRPSCSRSSRATIPARPSRT